MYLFAFVEREDVDRWDVVVSAEWSDQKMSMAVFFVSKALALKLEPGEMSMLARIVIIPSDTPDVREMPASLSGTMPSDEKVIHVSFLGLDIRRAFVFKAQLPSARLETRSFADVGVMPS